MENEKWAVILSGQPRSEIEKAHNEFLIFVQGIKKDIDVFCHMMISDDVLSVWGDGGWNKAAGKSPVVLKSTENVINVWNPIKYKIENYNDFDFKNKNSKLAAGLSMTYGIKKSFELLKEHELENNIKYDYVIRYRYDLNLICSSNLSERMVINKKMKEDTPLFAKIKEPFNGQSIDFWGNNGLPDKNLILQEDKKIDWNWIKKEIDDENTVIVSPGWNWGTYGCCDLFLIGSRNSMEKYSLYHDKFEELKSKYEMNEGVLRHYLEKIENIEIMNYYFGDVGIYR